MPELTKRANRDGLTDPIYRKASLLKIALNYPRAKKMENPICSVVSKILTDKQTKRTSLYNSWKNNSVGPEIENSKITGKLPDIRPDNRISGIINQPDIQYPDSFNIRYPAGY